MEHGRSNPTVGGKSIWTLRRAAVLSPDEFARRCLASLLSSGSAPERGGRLASALLPVDPEGAGPDAVVTCSEDGRAAAFRGAAFGSWVAAAEGWRVEEVVHWDELGPPDERGASPGVQMIAFVRRRPGLDPGEFERRYRAHADVARVHHPGIRRYVQNFVRAPVADASPLDAVAQLSFASRDDFARRFYRDEGSRAVVAADVATFLERRGSWSLLAAEWLRRA